MLVCCPTNFQFALIIQNEGFAVEKIIPILERFPARKFSLVGDSGEQGPEVYGDIAGRFPDSIQHILIRELEGASRDDARQLGAFEEDAKAGVPDELWKLFDDPRQLTASGLLDVTGR